MAALIDAMADPDELVRLRAADALEQASTERPDILAPHVAAILGPVADLPQHDLRWHIAQIIPRLPLDEAQLRRALAVLRASLRGESRIARTFAFDGLVRLADREPFVRAAANRAIAAARERGSRPTARERASSREGAPGLVRHDPTPHSGTGFV